MGASRVKVQAPASSLLQHHPDLHWAAAHGLPPSPPDGGIPHEPGGGWGASVSPPAQTGTTALHSGAAWGQVGMRLSSAQQAA